jgi:uncharacterized membrane protein
MQRSWAETIRHTADRGAEEDQVRKNHTSEQPCVVCGKKSPRGELVPGGIIRSGITALIRRDHTQWTPDSFICRDDLSRYRSEYVRTLLESEKGELDSLEEEVIESLRAHELVTTNVEEEFEQEWNLGQRLADKVASFGGSWTFLIFVGIFLAFWIALNTVVLLSRPIDPYPFILLNLLLSCVAAIQAPIIMMSQNRQEAKDRLRAQHDYQVNLKAELEIRQLHEKIDHLLSHQWERLVEIQEIQLELLSQIDRPR